MTKRQHLEAIEKLLAVKAALEAFGYPSPFGTITIAEALTMFRTIDNAIQLEFININQCK